MWDVIVVGAGPAGTAASKRCAEYGLNTLLLEKRKLPRDKVCDGMVMGPVAHTLIRQEFGDIPKNILSKPYYLSGYMFHVPGIGSQKLENFTPLAWRRDLDYWMNQKAQAKGVEIWQASRVTGLRLKGQGFSVEIEQDKQKSELEAGFLVGADGAASIVRKFLFPDLKVRYSQIYQECYQGELDLDKKYYHWFYPVEYAPLNFGAHHKGDFIIIDVGGRLGQIKQFLIWVKNFLAKNYNFDISQKPVWRGGCLEPVMYKQVTSYTFSPAKGNALLVGDASGFCMPVSGEGIGPGIKSGLLAADSIIRAIESGGQPDRIYLTKVGGIISVFKEIYPRFKGISEETKAGGHSLPEVLRDAYHSTLRMF